MHIYSRKMKTASACKNNKLDVFDFTEDVEVPAIAVSIKKKLENPSSAMDKYLFLQNAAAGKNISEEINYVPSVDIDAINIDRTAISLIVEEDSSAIRKPSDDVVTLDEQLPQSSAERLEPGTDISRAEKPDSDDVVTLDEQLPQSSPERLEPGTDISRPEKPDSDDFDALDEQLPQSSSERLEPGTDISRPEKPDSDDAVTLDEQLPQSSAERLEPGTDISRAEKPDSDDVVTLDEQLPQSSPERLEPGTDISRPEKPDSDDFVTLDEQLPQSSSERLEQGTDISRPEKPDSDDAVTLDEQLPQSSPERLEPGTDISRGEFRALTGVEITTANVAASPLSCKLTSTIPDSLPSVPEPQDETVDMVSDENRGACERSSSTSSDIAEDDGDFAGPSSDCCIGEWCMDNEDITTVVFHPDYIVYHDSYCTESVLTFTSSYLEMEGSTDDEENRTFKFQWAIDDILHIRSHWYERVNLAMVEIHLLQTKDVECPPGTKLRFAVVGPDWFVKHEAITSLNNTYKALWSSLLDSEEDLLGHAPVSLRRYFPNFDQAFEEVIYPKGDVDAVSISKRDVDLLQPDTFVNDTIIDFYIKYLKNKIKPEERHRFHFFNSFFFRKLADPDKDPLNASEGRAAFQRVKKWTRKVNLFEKDFVFIPVNYNYHWSLLVMCHLGEVATYQDEDVNESTKVPCVLHMDSIRGSHTGLKGLLQSYLREEWKERHPDVSEDISLRFDNLRFISLELPQQQNSFDCGLFLLHYVELFLEQAPVHFNPFCITKSSNFLNVDWFHPAEASLKRAVIERVIYDLLEHPSQEGTSAAGNNGTAVQFFPEKCNTSVACQSSKAEQGFDISLLQSSTSTHCAGDLGMVTPFEPGSFLGSQHPAFNQTTTFDEYKSSLTAIEEEVKAGGQFDYPSEDGLQQQNEITPDVSTFPYSSQDFRRTSWYPGISEHVMEHKNIDSSPEASISGCEDSFEEVDINDQLDAEVGLKDRRDQPRSPSQETRGVPLEMLDDDARGDDLPSSMNILSGFSYHFSDLQQNVPAGSDNCSGLESDVLHPTKKMRMTEVPLEEGGITSSPSKDLHL